MSQFAIHQDLENQVPRRGKAANTKNVTQVQKRAVLGVITNQANQPNRVQPSRAAKPKVCSSNFNSCYLRIVIINRCFVVDLIICIMPV